MHTAQSYLQNIHLPESASHKGQNGKLQIIGGSDLFHAASRWSLDVASKFVDMVFYSSVPANNELIREAKQNFWNGIVIEREQVEEYIQEADVILIGPGMTRTSETEEITNQLLKKYPTKKWVIDAGALQMVDPKLITEKCILTPHHKEWEMFCENAGVTSEIADEKKLFTHQLVQQTHATFLLKGATDFVFNEHESVEVGTGNGGMTKGGTGDVLAGLVAALYCTHDALTAAVVGSYINKKAGESLSQKVGPYFNASDLVEEIPAVLWKEFQAR
jgi:ADP-dependent NAD(P)H-hydrate dehydratase / NAD(P)H-hydrate epimerase